ncbi:MAG: hypothetical protein HY810_02065 [Candidatus Omnitrophica bacterium]|nr:hypothetical protein [Candidatus Omnitrophota bacterium]
MALKKTKTKQLGLILVEKKLLTQEQVDKALEIQLKEGGLLGQILVKLGFVTQEQIDNCINEQTVDTPKLENVLREMGIISEADFAKIIVKQKNEGGSFAKAITSIGILSEEDLVSTLVTQFGFPYLPLSNYDIDAEIVKFVPKKTAQEFCLIPVDKIGNILTLAMVDPLNAEAKDGIRKITGLNVEAFISTFSDITNAISKYYV